MSKRMNETPLIKSKSTKNKRVHYRHTAKEMAEEMGVSVSYVHKIRQKRVELDTPLAQKILLADELCYDGGTKLLQEVARIVK